MCRKLLILIDTPRPPCEVNPGSPADWQAGRGVMAKPPRAEWPRASKVPASSRHAYVHPSALGGGEGRGGLAVGQQVEVGVQCAVKHGETEAEGCFIGVKSDTLIRIMALTNVDFRAGPEQNRAGHSRVEYTAVLYKRHVLLR